MADEVTFDQIKGAIGSLLLLWSTIERTVRADVAAANGGELPKSAYGLAAVLNAWKANLVAARQTRPYQASLASEVRARLQRPLDIRNGICHGLVGISSEYNGTRAELTWDLNGGQESVTWEELEEIFSWLAGAPHAIGILSHAAAEPDDFKASKRLPEPGWWASEFGIAAM